MIEVPPAVEVNEVEAFRLELQAQRLERERAQKRRDRFYSLTMWLLAAVAIANLVNAGFQIARMAVCK